MERVAHQAVEKKVVVVSHRGIVKHGRHFRTAGVLEREIVGSQFSVRSIYTQNRLKPVPMTIYRVNWRPMDIP